MLLGRGERGQPAICKKQFSKFIPRNDSKKLNCLFSKQIEMLPYVEFVLDFTCEARPKKEKCNKTPTIDIYLTRTQIKR